MSPDNKEYLEDLVVHLRLRCVPGDEIGAFLEEARDHLEASGEDPEDAFGPAETYARDLAISKGRRATPDGWSRRELGLAAVHFVAWFLLVRSMIAWMLGDPMQITVGVVVGLVLGVALTAWVVWPALVAAVTGRAGWFVPVIAILFSVAMVALVVDIGGRVVWTDPVLFEGPAPAFALVALVAVVVTMIPLIRRPDPIRRPQ